MKLPTGALLGAMGGILPARRPLGSADKVPEAAEYEKKVAAARHARHARKRRENADDEAS